VIYTGGSGKGEIPVGKTIFKEQNKIPLPEKGGKNWQREGGKKEVIPDNMTLTIIITRSRGENK
jgi:hypothetical protein